MSFGYQAGDKIYIFSGRANGFVVGDVAKVTPTGRVTVKTREAQSTRSFTNRGDEIGNKGSTWNRGPYIIEKAKQEEFAMSIRVEFAKKKEWREYRDELDSLASIRLEEDTRANVIERLRKLADRLEASSHEE